MLSAALVAVTGCARATASFAPHLGGNGGVLTASAELPRDGVGYRCLRQDDRHHGLPRFVHVIERAAKAVAEARPGATLGVGDLSARKGGQLLPHFSHRTGRDADLLLYLTTLDGAPVESPGFIPVGPDGLAWDQKRQRFLRFDVERTWLLVKTLVLDPDARVQWIFAHRSIQALLLEWARARGEPGETLARAMAVMHEPHPGGLHDDHLHLRSACTAEEVAAGCDPRGPARAWIDRVTDPDDELALAILRPLGEARSAQRVTGSDVGRNAAAP
jgi:penicillin-insensitive murein endopeptidase